MKEQVKNVKYTAVDDRACMSMTLDATEHIWRYIAAEEAEKEEIRPEDVVGDLLLWESKEEPRDYLEQSWTVYERSRHRIGIYPLKKRLGLRESVIGFIPCENEQDKIWYVRVVGRQTGRLFLLILLVLMAAGGLSSLLLFP